MNKKLRYFLILITIIAFAILAPLTVLFVTGVKLDVRNQNYQQTGILVALTQPDNADVILNDSDKSKTPATFRFLNRGEYKVSIKKEGYFDWSKVLAVEPNRITFNYEGVDAVQLIKRPAETVLPVNDVSSFVYANDEIWYGGAQTIGWFKPDSKTIAPQNIPIPFTPTKLVVMNDEEYLLATDRTGRQAVINTRNKTAVELPTQIIGSNPPYIAPDGTVLILKDETLYRFDPVTKIVSPVLKNLTGFTMQDNTGYFATKQDDITIDTRKWRNGTFGDAEILNETGLKTKSINILITKNKQLFVLAGSELYRINQQPDLLSNQISSIALDPQTQELTFTTPNELWFYNFLASKPQLLTRITGKINQFDIRSSIGYGFIANQSGLTAWEIDSRHNQNQYKLFTAPVQSMAIDDAIKTVYGLIDGKIVSTKIR